MQDKTEREFVLQRLLTSAVGFNSPPYGLSHILASPLRRVIFGTTSFIFDL